jgi:hypothetical protein
LPDFLLQHSPEHWFTIACVGLGGYTVERLDWFAAHVATELFDLRSGGVRRLKVDLLFVRELGGCPAGG